MLRPNKNLPRYLAWLAILGLLVAAGATAWQEHAPVLTSAAQIWGVSDTPAAADAVVVLGGGSERPARAAQLYRAGLASRILVDEEDSRKGLSDLDIPPQAVEIFGSGLRSTYEEACALKDWAGKHAARRIIVPTELFASRRVRWIFAREMRGVGAEIMIDVVPIRRYAADNWWRSKEARDQFMTEIAKYFYYRIRYAVAAC